MKKLLSVSAAALTLLASAALISCGAEGDDYSGATDTVLQLASPSVSAKAYPGVNYITWASIVGANSYELIRTGDGETSADSLGTFTNQYEYADIAASDHILVNGKSYTYTVYAISSSDPSRDVYVKSSQASTSVTAVVPQAGLSVTEFTDSYSKNYFSKKWASTTTSDNANVTQTVANGTIDGVYYGSDDGALYATYPATAGFKYGVKFVTKTGVYDVVNTLATSYKTNYKEDYTANYSDTSVSSGEKEVFLTIASVSDLYQPVVYDLGSYTVEDIGESTATGTPSAQWLTSSKVRVNWTAAVLSSTNKATLPTNYKVYRADSSDNYTAWTLLTGTVVAGEKVTTATSVASDVYYIDDTSITENTLGYRYYVVHTDGKRFASTYKTATLSAFALTQTGEPTVYATAYNNDTTGVADTIKIVATTNDTDYNQTLDIYYVKLATDYADSAVDTYAADSFTSITLANNNGMTSPTTGNSQSYTVYLTDQSAGTYLIKVTASETGKTDNTVYTLVTVGAADVSVNGIYANFDKYTINESDVKAVTIVDNEINDTTDALSNYTYDLYKVVITATENYNNIVTVTTTAVNSTSISLRKVTNASGDSLYEDYGLTGFVGKYAAAVSVSYETGSLITNAFYVRKSLASDATVYNQVKVSGTYN